MSQREAQFEAMLQAAVQEYQTTCRKLEALKAQDKTKTATYRQLLGDKLMLQNILTRYRVYGLLDSGKAGVKTMNPTLRLRPFRLGDAETIVTWCADETDFYKWSAGILGEYPLTPERFNHAMAARDTGSRYFPFVVEDDTEVAGFFILRQPGEDPEELRFGFVILAPRLRGKGCGKQMLQLGMQYAFDLYGAKKVTLGVFANNSGAYHCYKALGFRETGSTSAYPIAGESWTCTELEMEKNDRREGLSSLR